MALLNAVESAKVHVIILYSTI